MSNISALEFVTLYMEAYKDGTTLSELATKLGTTYTHLAGRKRVLIQKGVKLPELVKGRRGAKRSSYTNIDLLNNIIRDKKEESDA